MRRTLGAALAIAAWSMGAPAAIADDPDVTIARARDAMLVDPTRAIALARTAQHEAVDPHRSAALATADWLEAEALNRIGDVSGAAGPLTRAEQLAADLPGEMKLRGEILLTRGSIHGARGETATALTSFLNAHREFVRAGDRRNQAISLICIAMLYNDAKDYPAALRYLGDALDAYPADRKLSLSIWNSRGIALQEQARYRDAAFAFRRAVAMAHQVGSSTGEAMFLRNLARNELKAGDLPQADAALAAAARVPSAGRDDARQLDAIAAQAAFQHGRVQEAGQLIDRAFAGVDLATTDLSLRDSHATAVAVYRALGRSDRALAHLDALKRLDDKATRLATEANSALMAARFDSANQDAKIARLRDAERLRRAREALQRARTERLFWLVGSGAGGVVITVLLIGLVTVRRSRDQVRAAAADLAVTNTALGKALAAKTEFLATTSHEIRTPLNGILGMTQVMLADADLAAPARERLGVVHDAGLTMRALVDDILDVAKMETGHLTLERAPFDLAGTLRDAARLWAEQAQAKGLRFVVDVERCPACVEGDAARVRQLAFNLLSNAVKFTATGSITLTAEAAGDGVRIAVADTGIGIPADKQAAVFESFRQADTSTTRRFGGTGLGLAIVRSVARAMGGDVTVASRPDQGSTFTLDLPLPAIAPAGSACAAPGANTLLVFERNPIARAMLRTLLTPHVDGVVFATTLDEAAPCLQSGAVTRVLVDDGTARAGGDPSAFVRAVVAGAGDAPVQLLWPVSADSERDELLALGVARVIAKPVTGAALVQALFATVDAVQGTTALVSRAA